MKTYTFASADEPVGAHMTGLISALELWAERAERFAEFGNGRTKSERDIERGKALTYREIISVIMDSNSIDLT